MVTISVKRPQEWDSCEVHVFADLHLGDLHVDGQHIMDRIKHCEETENCVVILNGDLFNNATRNSVSDVYAEAIKPMEQIQRGVELFQTLADQGKIVAIVTGNHERRSDKDCNLDLTEIFAAQLGLSNCFSKGGIIVFLRFGKVSHENHGRRQMYSIFCVHGTGGGRKEGSKLQRLSDMASIADTDIYIHSHTHLPMIMKESFIRVDTANSCIKSVDKLFVNTSASLDYGGYGEVFEFKPASKDTPVIYLDGHRRRMTAML